MTIKDRLPEIKDYVVAMRRHFHQNPELSFEEFETTKTIAKELDKMGIPYEFSQEDPKVGLVALIDSGRPGKALALRSDIDALTVFEKNDVPYKSKVEGRMHACGHDGHTAILLGAARLLNECRDKFDGKIYLIFQPAEELGLGSKYMMRQGHWLEEVDNIFGAHLWVHLPVGTISVEAGERMAAGDMFDIKIHGKSAHGSEPQSSVDAVLVGSAVVQALQAMVSRTYSPLDSVVVSVGTFEAGTRFNIIAGEARLTGTCRYFTQEIADRIDVDMDRIIKGVCEAYGASYELEYKKVMGPLANDPASSEIAEGAVRKVLGPDALVKMKKVTGGEDFSWYLKEKPGCFAFIGVGNPDKGASYSHHSDHFNMDEDALAGGAGVYAQYALDYLSENKK